MAMTMEELFYGGSEPVYFAHYGESEAVSFYNRRAAAMAPSAFRSVGRTMELVSFDLMVPMCCARCEDEVRDALFALRGVRDVVCDPRNQRVTVTGCLDPAQALKQVRRVKSGAVFWSDASSCRYEISSCRKSQDNRDRRSYVQSEQRPRGASQYNRSSSDAYSRSRCPAYRDGAKTYYVSLNPTIATVEVKDY